MKAAVFIRLKIEIKPERTVCGWSSIQTREKEIVIL